MDEADRPATRGSELFVGLLVVAFVVFLLWFFLLKPREPTSAVPDATPIPSALTPVIIDEPNSAFQTVIATPTPQPTPTPTLEPRATPTPTVFVYIVQAGDTLSSIAARFGSSVDDLVRANRIVNRDQLQIGQELTIP